MAAAGGERRGVFRAAAAVVAAWLAFLAWLAWRS